MKRIALLLPMALAAPSCGEDPKSRTPPAASRNEAVSAPTAPSPSARPARQADSLAETPFSPASAQGAATVVETYYALIEAGKYDEARALRWDHGTLGAAAFRDSFAPFAEYHATVGAPSEIQGAAGSLYVEVPVHLYGQLKTGKPFGTVGTITLRRANDVPGSSSEQRRWRIYTSD